MITINETNCVSVHKQHIFIIIQFGEFGATGEMGWVEIERLAVLVVVAALMNDMN